jgi:hypothetical protein
LMAVFFSFIFRPRKIIVKKYYTCDCGHRYEEVYLRKGDEMVNYWRKCHSRDLRNLNFTRWYWKGDHIFRRRRCKTRTDFRKIYFEILGRDGRILLKCILWDVGCGLAALIQVTQWRLKYCVDYKDVSLSWAIGREFLYQLPKKAAWAL